MRLAPWAKFLRPLRGLTYSMNFWLRRLAADLAGPPGQPFPNHAASADRRPCGPRLFLSERTANFILRNLRGNLAFPCCGKMLNRFAFPPSVHDHAHYRLWNQRGYGMKTWSEKKGEAQLHAQ